ncbi:MAG TPA: hypothetical protein CFH84_05860 [Sulfurimonas sp. UBA12504]|nr:MAG: hypothetical protein A2019_01725 [Sulfurimonas sp. GWF2_37_8]DAB30112.1 MAG TPA: hypothetical protein CFH84_05860 [Sulfurimonas sp. UBA12504]
MKNIFILVLLLSLNLYAGEKKNSADEIDHIALATILLKDGHSDRANEELKQVNLTDKKVDFVKYYTLKGLILTNQSAHEEANKAFQEALNAGQNDKSLYLYMAQNSFKLERYEETLTAIQNAGVIAETKASIYALKAEANYRLGNKDEALAILQTALKKFPDAYECYKQRFNYFVTEKLYQSALKDAEVYLKNATPNEKTSLAFIATLRKSGEVDKAIILAEKANLQFEESANITVLLAHLYLDKGMIQAAANLFDQASIEDAKYTQEAAEMMRRAKEFSNALYKNSQLLETKEKLKQRIAIYLEFEDYERVIASQKALYRSGLIEDENIRYALAYAYYKAGDFDSSENELKRLSKADLFQKATEIRKNMQKCIANHWECEL